MCNVPDGCMPDSTRDMIDNLYSLDNDNGKPITGRLCYVNKKNRLLKFSELPCEKLIAYVCIHEFFFGEEGDELVKLGKLENAFHVFIQVETDKFDVIF